MKKIKDQFADLNSQWEKDKIRRRRKRKRKPQPRVPPANQNQSQSPKSRKHQKGLKKPTSKQTRNRKLSPRLNLKQPK
jgi:hypothetical protein